MYDFDPMRIEENHQLNQTCNFFFNTNINTISICRVKTELCVFSRCGLVFWNSTTGSATTVSFITLATFSVLYTPLLC